MLPSGRLLTVPEVAALLGISRSQAYALVKRGALASIRVSAGVVRVHPEDLARFLEARRTGGGAR